MKHWKIVLFIWCYSVSLGFTETLPDRLQFKYLNTKHGLSQSNAITLIEDQQGMIWIGTRDGLNRYDGKKVEIFRNDPKDPNSLSNSDILDIALDQRNGLWIGTYHGLNHYDFHLRKFTRYLSGPSDSDRISNNTVRSVATMADGTVLVGTRDGLNVLNPATGKFLKFFHRDNDPNSIPDNHVFKVYIDAQEKVWIGTAKGLCVMHSNKNGYTFEQVRLLGGKEIYVQEILTDQDKNIWVGTQGDGLIKIDANYNVLNHYLKENSDFTNNNVRTMVFDQQGRLWVGTYNGLNIIQPSGELTTAYSTFYNINDLSGNKVKSLHCSQDGTVWIGTYYGGVSIWNAQNFNFNYINQNTTNNRLTHNVISSIDELYGKFYFGTEGGGIISWDKKKDQFINFNTSNSVLKSNNIKFLKIDSLREELWVCTLDSGVTILNMKTSQLVQHINTRNGLKHNAVYDIIQYGNDHFWVATFGGGLHLYNKKTDEIERILTTRNSQLSDDEIRTMLVDKDNNLWVGTQNGLTYLEIDPESFEVLNSKQFFMDEKRGISADIIEIFQNSKDDIYVGTREYGMHKLENGQFQFIDLFSDLSASSQYIQAIEEDKSGTLWVSSNNGIMSYNPISGIKKIYQESDGLVSNGFNNKASQFGSDGWMYFAGPNGITQFNPNAFTKNRYAPDVKLMDLWINNQLVLPNDSTQILYEPLDQTEAISLRYDQTNFTIDFAFSSFVNSDKNQFVYRVKGLDNQWKQTTDSRANFTIQQSGNYEFQIRGLNNDGLASENLRSLKIRVHPAPWFSSWAIFLYACLLLLMAIAVHLVMKRQTNLKYELELEHQMNQQQQEINKSKLQFFTNISHEFRTPLTLILGTLEQIISEYKGSSAVFNRLAIMQKNTQQLMKLINQLMDFRKMENDKLKLEVTEGDIVSFTKTVFQSFNALAVEGQYDYTFECQEENINLYFDPHKLERVLYNLLSNAFKYTPAKGKIQLSIIDDKKNVYIKIKDSGEGIPEDYREKIFDRFYQVSEELRKNQQNYGTGLGLAISKSIVELHQGELAVSSEGNKGSCFSILLQKGKEHFSEETQIIEDFSPKTQSVTEIPTTTLATELNMNQLVNDQTKSTVLIVEDNVQVRNFIMELLSADYNVVEAENGEIGLSKVVECTPDLIISDVMMPVMDGITFCKEIKTNIKTSHIPIILLTARTADQFKYEGLELGADEYMSKPFSVQELKLKVRNLLRFVDSLKVRFKEGNVIRPSEITISSVDEQLLNKAIEIMDNNIDNQFFNVEQYTEELGVSRTMLFTKIKKWTGLTPNEFILSMRMKRATQLIEQNKINISQICYKVGFKDPKYFSKSFKKYHGCTPTAYSKKFQENIELGH
ncbi:two-component regulator propeller domain-containing protein [Flammeovirga sp. OC4]|uniref:hybrid sensor histidine kinase/response regulator transcription factor n=1 Tax=Flammeovirga sp. OC4 TaxID=1382345 RepID=UPI0005C4D1E5|nr:two-component regulator propeller domain-containing protein [Flammeovirga sp. OC4]